MSGVNKVGTALIVVFAVLLVSLIAELFYVLYRRRRFRRQSFAGGGQNFAGNPSNSPSKELLYFFCWKNESRVEPQEAPQPPPRHGHGAATTEVDDVLKWQGLYGSSRVLFTIKEEDREGAESENFSSAEKGTRMITARSEEERVGLEAGTLAEVAVTIEVDEATPFSTPCASPPYYTPWASPSREVDSSENKEEFSVPYVSLEGHVV